MRNILASSTAILSVLTVMALSISCSQAVENERKDPVSLVNPLMGTDSEFSLSNGNTYPAIARPWGMNFWTPMTAPYGDGWAYKYDDHKINGIKQTHQPSPWINDYAAFSLMAVTGRSAHGQAERASWFSHKAETVLPHYYSVYLADHDVTMEISPTDRAAIFRFRFPETDSAFVVLDAFPGGSRVEVFPEEGRIEGYCRNNHGGVPENFHNYFVLQFDRPLGHFWTWDASGREAGRRSVEADHAGALLHFATDRGEEVHVRVASSFISPQQARLNLERELGERSFDEIREEGREAWNLELSKISVDGPVQQDIRTFYSALYRVLLFPRMFHEVDAGGDTLHYSPYNGEVLPGLMYTDNGFWDTFRAVFPLFTLVYPEQNALIMRGLVNTYKESGWLPEWASPGHRSCMIGSNSASLIADSWLKGIRGYDIESLYEAMVKNTGAVHPYVSSVGRLGHQYYNELGYIPYDVNIRENTARTLEYAYADFCLWKLGGALDRPADELKTWRQRALNYRNVFNAESGWMHGRLRNGEFQEPFSLFKWGDAFTEGNSLHYSWSVFQDVQGLIELMGGDEAFVRKLDTVFALPPLYDDSYYGFPIHEIREMQITNMGNYAHGNQPIQHMLYLYNYAGQPWKTQERVREVMQKLYAPTPDGYCGDEDNGQTSAWYVFSALGFYPVCPGTDEYLIGSPLFTTARIDMGKGRELLLKAPGNGPGQLYVDEIRLGGKPYELNYFRHTDLRAGGRIQFRMSRGANRERGTGQDARPYSMSKKN